jgi:hypothetical protein
MFLWIILAIAAVFLFFAFQHWRRDERDNPQRRFKGPALVRYAKHVAHLVADAVLGGP